MKILVGNIPLPANRFLVDLNRAIEGYHEITHCHETFWQMQGSFDVVHLHFPEYMTYEVEEAYRSELSLALLESIEQRLKYWSSRARIVVTRHVLLPHDAVENPAWEKLYELVYQYCSGVVHFAQPSVNEFNSRYASTLFFNGPPVHKVVPHHNYATLPNNGSREQARRHLGLAENARVMLAFGQIRNDAECELVLKTFRNMNAPSKVLVCSRWRERLADVSWIRLKYLLRDLTRLFYRLHPRYRFNYGFVDEADAQYYLNAADVLFIPRLKVLNSGNVTLGMTFGKVVVGPDWLDVGHLLRETGNVVFDPEDPATASKAMDRAMELAEAGVVGPANRDLAMREWSVQQCAQQYADFYQTLTQKSG